MNDQDFKKRVKRSFVVGEIEVLGVDESGGYVSATGDGREGNEVGWV